MSAYWPAQFLGRLHVDLGEYSAEEARWRRPPTASYACCCGFYERVSGPKRVAHFTASVPDQHRASCRHHANRRAS